MTVRELSARLGSLVVLRGVLRDELVVRFRALLREAGAYAGDTAALAGAAAEFEAALLPRGEVWSDVLLDIVLNDDNLCMRRGLTPGGAGEVAEACLASELAALQAAGSMTLEDVLAGLTGSDALANLLPPPWKVRAVDYAAAYRARRADVGQKGFGMFATHHVFTLTDGALTPVRWPDPQRLADLPGYEREREKIIANTEALLAGLPSANVLLYGDAGTGKSSTVKAIANEYAPRGLRLVEVKKHQLYQMPALMDELADNPLKFILFIDDLSFAANDDNFAALKAILEGSVGGRSHNVAVYATSNRRHLVRQTISERAGDEMDRNETIREKTSLADRFGIRILYEGLRRDEYLALVDQLAAQQGCPLSPEELHRRAIAWERHHGSTTPRTALQFVLSL